MLLKTFMAKFRLSPVMSSESTSWYVLDGGEKKKKEFVWFGKNSQ